VTRTLIIDDEPPARAALRGLLRAHVDFVLAGEADTLAEAKKRLAVHDYDLVLLDIQLRGGTGFDLLPCVWPEARIIFVTACDQHAVRAFEVNALDYLIKPVRPERLADALRRLAPSPSAKPWPALAPNDLVHVKLGNGTTRLIALPEIAMIEACENYSEVHLGDGTRLLVRRTMKTWEDTLPASHFVRVHRGTIINLSRYRGADRESYETTLLRLEGLAEPVRASFRYLPELRMRLVALGLQF
jgi:two-component system LytT family response regulator